LDVLSLTATVGIELIDYMNSLARYVAEMRKRRAETFR